MDKVDSRVKPRHSVGDSVSWVCNSCGKIHSGKVSFAVPGFAYDCPHYEVLSECCGEEKPMYVDEHDVLDAYALQETSATTATFSALSVRR